MDKTSLDAKIFSKPNSGRLKADVMLLLAAIVWGSAFVPQRMIANELGVFVFNGLRFILGGLVLLPLARNRLHVDRKKLLWIFLAAFMLFLGYALQQAGLKTTTAGNAGFITGLYVVIVPVYASLFWKDRLPWNAWLAASLSVAGLFLLSVDANLTVNPGDKLELAGAAFWALHIIIVGMMVKRMDVIAFSTLQFFACGLLNLICGLILEPQTFQFILPSAWAILYTGIFSVGAGYTLQAAGQKNSPPTDAAIILSMEAVFAAFFGFLFIHEALTMRKVFGCLLIFSAIILAQVVDHKRIGQEHA